MMTPLEMGFVMYCLLTGIVVGWVWASAPLKRKVEELESELQWEKAKTLARELDLQRVREKLENYPRRKRETKEKR